MWPGSAVPAGNAAIVQCESRWHFRAGPHTARRDPVKMECALFTLLRTRPLRDELQHLLTHSL